MELKGQVSDHRLTVSNNEFSQQTKKIAIFQNTARYKYFWWPHYDQALLNNILAN